MYVFSGVGNAAGHTSDVCVDMENNDFDGIGRNGSADLRLDRATDSFLAFADFNATAINPPASPNLRDNLRAKNPLSPALTLAQVGPNGVTATPSTPATCPSERRKPATRQPIGRPRNRSRPSVRFERAEKPWRS